MRAAHHLKRDAGLSKNVGHQPQLRVGPRQNGKIRVAQRMRQVGVPNPAGVQRVEARAAHQAVDDAGDRFRLVMLVRQLEHADGLDALDA